jgi:hypothetical protein
MGSVHGFDMLRALKLRCTRSIQNYLSMLSLPDKYGASRSQPRQTFRLASLFTSEPRKRCISSGPGTNCTDPLARISRAALDMLTVLREESAHVPLSDDAHDTSSDRNSQSRVTLPAELSNVPTDSSFFLSRLCA